MGYDRDNFIRIRREYEEKSRRGRENAERHRAELHREIPELRDIDNAIAGTAADLVRCVMTGGDVKAEAKRLEQNAAELHSARAELLKMHGYPADETDIKYECAECKDTGFIGTKVCKCMKRRLIMAQYESSGIGRLMKTQSFESFDLGYYKGDSSVYNGMKHVYDVCRDYSEKFSSDTTESLLLIGNTGLGKTHLSTSIAKTVIDKAFDVKYETAQNVFADYEYERFSRASSEIPGTRTDKYIECDLLIVDDLGTELTNSFTVSCLYNLINSRLNSGKPMILNTNLDQNELRKRYSDRITSRLFGEFIPLMFAGKDIRQQKLLSQ